MLKNLILPFGHDFVREACCQAIHIDGHAVENRFLLKLELFVVEFNRNTDKDLVRGLLYVIRSDVKTQRFEELF